MALTDRLRLVRFRDGGQIQTLLDLADNTTYALVRDTLAFHPPAKNAIQTQSSRRYGGARTVAEQHGNGSVEAEWIVAGANADTALANANQMLSLLEAPFVTTLLEWRPANASRSVYFEVRGTGAWEPHYSWIEFSALAKLRLAATIELAPVAYGDPYDIYDPFLTDTITDGDWSIDAGAGISVASGGLAVSTTAQKRFRYVGRNYPYGDVRVSGAWRTGASTTSSDCRIALCMDTTGLDTMLAARIVGGATNQLQIIKVVSGTVTVLGTVAFSPSANTVYLVVVRREGHRIFANVHGTGRDYSGDEASLSRAEGYTGTTSVSYRLTAAEEQQFTLGHVGGSWTPVDTAERLEAFRALPFTYQAHSVFAQPPMYGLVYGDVPAEVDAWFSMEPSTQPQFGLAAFARDTDDWNRVCNGDADLFGAGSLDWDTSALSGLINAGATATIQTTDAKYGAQHVQTVSTAGSTAQGARQNLPGVFEPGLTYTAWAWVKLSSGTTPVVQLRLGNAGGTDVASSFNVTPTTTGWSLISVQWTPTARYFGAVLALVSSPSVANAITVRWDAMTVVGAHRATLSGAITSGQTTLPITKVPLDWPMPSDTPWFDLIIDPGASTNEIVRVRNNGAAGRDQAFTYTVERGVDGSTAQSHSSAAIAVPLPFSAANRSGRGTQPPMGIGQAIADLSGYRTAGLARTTIADTLNGTALQIAAVAAGSYTAVYTYDPSSLAADDFADTVDVEFWARCHWSSTNGSGGVAPTVVVAAQYATFNLSVPYSQSRSSREMGTSGVLIRNTPASGSNIAKLNRLGVITFPTTPGLWIVTVTITFPPGASGTFDFSDLITLPVRGRSCLPTLRDPSAGYPSLFAGASNSTKIFRSDGTGAVLPRMNSQGGFAGSEDIGTGIQLEAPPGVIDGVFMISTGVPDNPAQSASNECSLSPQAANTQIGYHAAIRPRYLWTRGLTSSRETIGA